MSSSEGPSKVSPWIYLGALGCLSVASIFFTCQNESLPTVVSSDRRPISSGQLKSFQDQLRGAFEKVPDWSSFCRDPATLMSSLRLEKGFTLSPLSRLDSRWQIPQRERDAWSRCQVSASIQQDFRKHFCFQMKASTAQETLWNSPLNLVEMSIELYRPGQKSALLCSEIEAGAKPEELVVYYTAYWSHEKQGKFWHFERLTGGLRQPIRWQQTQASAR